jgi:hypothetical protein
MPENDLGAREASSPPPPATWRRRLAPWIGIDPRGLAALRIGLGAVLIVDLSMRTGRFRALYTDEGLFPRGMVDPWMREWILPLHMWGGSFAWQALLFGAAVAAALLLLLGLHSRVACVVSWLLLTSLQARQPLVLNFGDDILRMGVFWAMFLPLGRTWSLDARRRGGDPGRGEPECSLASAAYLLQIAFIYLFTALLKTGPGWRRDGTALYYALSMDAWVTGVGVRLREIPLFVQLMTRATMILEAVGPFLLFVPVWWLRALTVLAFLTLHLGIAASYTLGIFPYTDLVVLLPFLPVRVWDAVERGLSRAGWVARATAAAPRPPAAWRGLGAAKNAVVATVLAYVFAYNLDSVGALRVPQWLAHAGHWLRVNQQWRMFTPDGPRFDGWFVIPGKLADGRQIDLSAHGPALTWQKPERVSRGNKPYRYSIYMWQMADPKTNHVLRRRWSDLMCRSWNATHPPGERLLGLEMHFMYEETLPPGQGVRIDPQFLHAHRCPGDGAEPAVPPGG